MTKLTHLDDAGKAHMVDVGAKPDTERVAVARGEIHMKQATFDLIAAGEMKKGDVFKTLAFNFSDKLSAKYISTQY